MLLVGTDHGLQDLDAGDTLIEGQAVTSLAYGGPGDDTLIAVASRLTAGLLGGPGSDLLRGPAGEVIPIGLAAFVGGMVGARVAMLFFHGWDAAPFVFVLTGLSELDTGNEILAFPKTLSPAP